MSSKILRDFDALCVAPGYHIHPVTGEVHIVAEQVQSAVLKTLHYGNIRAGVDHARHIGAWGEEKIRYCVNGLSRVSKKSFDYTGYPEGVKIEVKTGNKKNGCVIKENQLQEYASESGNRYFAFVFYKTRNNISISQVSTQSISEIIYLEEIYIVPLELVVYFFNTHPSQRIRLHSEQKSERFKKIYAGQLQRYFSSDFQERFGWTIYRGWGKSIFVLDNGHISINKQFTSSS